MYKSTLALYACCVYLFAVVADSAQCSYYEQDDFIFPLNVCVNSSVAHHSTSSSVFYCHVGLLGRPNIYKRVYSNAGCSGSAYDAHLGYCTSPQCNCGDSSSSSSSSSCNTQTFYYSGELCDPSEIAEQNITVVVNECVDGKMLVTKTGSNYLYAVHYGDETCATSKPVTVQRQCFSSEYTAPAGIDTDTDIYYIYDTDIDPDTDTSSQHKSTSKAPYVPLPDDDNADDSPNAVHLHMGAIYGAVLGLGLWGIGCCLCCLIQRCCRKGAKARRHQIANADARKLIDNDIELNKEGVKSESRENCDEVQEIVIPGMGSMPVPLGQGAPNQFGAAAFRSMVDDILVKYENDEHADSDSGDVVVDDADIPAAAYSDCKDEPGNCAADEEEEIEISEGNEGIVDEDVDVAEDAAADEEQDVNDDSNEQDDANVDANANDENDE